MLKSILDSLFMLLVFKLLFELLSLLLSSLSTFSLLCFNERRLDLEEMEYLLAVPGRYGHDLTCNTFNASRSS